MSRSQAQSFQQNTQEVCNLSTFGSSIEVQFVNNEMEYASFIAKPLFCLLEDCAVAITHQHDPQHAEVCDQYVRRMILHIPTRPHLGPIEAREKISYVCFTRM